MYLYGRNIITFSALSHKLWYRSLFIFCYGQRVYGDNPSQEICMFEEGNIMDQQDNSLMVM
jgi:hypothetical protein